MFSLFMYSNASSNTCSKRYAMLKVKQSFIKSKTVKSIIHLIFLFHSNLRELAFQISEQFEALGSLIGVKCGKTSFV